MILTDTFRIIERKIPLNQILVHRVLLFCVLLLGTILRFYDVNSESYWIDEVKMVHVAGTSFEKISSEVFNNGRPPIFVVLAHGWIRAFGASEAATRSLSASLGVLSLILLYQVGLQLFDQKVALVSTFVMAISEFQIYYGQDFRYYSLVVFLSLAATLGYVQMLKRKALGGFVMYVLASALLFHTHFFSIFIIAAYQLHFLLRWRAYKATWLLWCLSQVLILLMIGPRLLPEVPVPQLGAPINLPGPQSIPDVPLWMPFFTLFKYIFPSTISPNYILLVVELGIVVGGIVLFNLFKGKAQRCASFQATKQNVVALARKSDELILTSLWLLCPILLPFVLSRLIEPIYLDRYTIGASPALYLLVGLGIVVLRRVISVPVSVGILCILVFPGLQQYYQVDIKEQWREIAAFVETHSTKDELVIFAPDATGDRQDAFDWYYKSDFPACRLTVNDSQEAGTITDLEQCKAGYERFWLIMHTEQDHHQLLSQTLRHLQANARLVTTQNFTSYEIYLFANEK